MASLDGLRRLAHLRAPFWSTLMGSERVRTGAPLASAVKQVGSTVRIRLLLTDPMCLYLFEMRSQIIEALSRVPGVETVEVEPVAGKLWWPERMAPQARERLETLRRERLSKLGLSAPKVPR
jgi:metal-sulfur cluster biosynthetic enzyme